MIDILAIRDRLNELPFREGKRQVRLGRISDHVDLKQPEAETEAEDDAAARHDTPEVLQYLQQLEDELNEHNLSLSRREDDPDVLYAVQTLRQTSQFDLSWMADAINWASRITVVAAVMAGLGVLGLWLDDELGTELMGILGCMIGVPLGVWLLILLTKRKSGR